MICRLENMNSVPKCQERHCQSLYPLIRFLSSLGVLDPPNIARQGSLNLWANELSWEEELLPKAHLYLRLNIG